MRNITIEMSGEELKHVLQAYQTLQLFMEKILSPNELYQTEFLQGIQEAIHDVQSGRIKEVSTFEDFIA
ncbi:MAG: hypothetical protein WCR46_09805 [Deltaproteobacteria bacterium]|jgi:hypothetical protein